MRYSVLFYTLMILAIISWLHQRSLASLLDIDLYRSWTGQKLIDQRNIREKAFWVRQQVNNLYQCMRWCWFFKACTVLTYTLDQQWCSLYKEKYTRISRHGLGNLHFIPNDNSIVVAMEGAAFSKKKVKETMRDSGCDKRPCGETEMCAPVKNTYEYVCIRLVSLYCSDNPPTIANSERNPDGVVSVMYSCAPHYLQTGTTFVSYCDRNSKRWSPIDMACNLIDCNAPAPVEGTTANPLSTLYGERMAYKCLDGGASPSASMSIECQADGHWSDPPEACVFVSCGRPPTALNTSPKILERPNTNTFPDTSLIELSVAVGGIIQFPCKLGYISPAGRSYVSECQADGTWSSTEDVLCTPLDCGNPPFFPNSHRQDTPFITASQEINLDVQSQSESGLETTITPLTTTLDSLVYYSCYSGYSFGFVECSPQGTYKSLLTLVCSVNGTWDQAENSYPNFDFSAGCQPVYCPT
ncbi:hypothetical protein RRG08_056798 [Elysia crispata]|uniref:Sushi domain-containing protein n=1 Tax=Elysia crispata TaxID=231223 RepID=A0AAE1ABI8_9GAST|nr:hypothetical protein RRG08_056798 [Elysia crispata]